MFDLPFPNPLFAVVASIVGNCVSLWPILRHVLFRYQSGALEQKKVPRKFLYWAMVSAFCWGAIFIVPLLLIGAYVFGLPWFHMGEVFLMAGAIVNLAIGAFLGLAGYAFLTLRLNG